MKTPSTDLMREIVLCASFRGELFHSTCAALLMLGLAGGDFCAASLPKEITQGDIHVSGLAVKALLKMGLIEKVGYIPSPNADAKGRPVLLLRIPSNKVYTAKTYLARQGYTLPTSPNHLPEQLNLISA